MTLNWFEKYGPVLAPDGLGGGGSAGASPSGSSSADGGAPSAPSPSGASSSVAPGTEPRPSTSSDAPATPEPSGGADDSPDFSAIFDGPSDAGSPEPAPQPQPVGVQPAAPVAPPAPAPQPAAPAVQQPGTSPAPSPQEATSGPAQPAQLDPADPVALSQGLVANEAAIVDHVAATMFKLSPEEIEALESNTVEAIPKLLAKSFVKAQVNALHHLGQMVPKMVQRQIEAVRKNATNEGKFYQRWPQLKTQGELVGRLAATYRQMNPSATFDKMVEELGPIVMMAAKLPMTQAAQPQAQAPMARQGNGVGAPQPTPFVPAMGGPGSPQAAEQLNEWEAVFSGDQ